jgi:hypothetical protein
MKTFKLLIPALLLPILVHAESSDQKLATRLAQGVRSVNGIVVRNVSKDYVDSAVKKLGGRATVKFGANDKLALASGGVIVGSGGDSRASRVTTDSRSNVMVQAPVIPVQSITVVGRDKVADADDHSFKACALKLEEKNGDLVPFDRDEQGLCALINAPIRLRPGKYIVTYQGTFVYATVAAGENKILPLREIYVPKSSAAIVWEVYRDHLAPEEVTKSANYMATRRCWYMETGDFSQYLGKVIDINGVIKDTPCALPIKNSYRKDGGEFVSVFPGTYLIKWEFYNEKQFDYTNNIVVK